MAIALSISSPIASNASYAFLKAGENVGSSGTETLSWYSGL